MSHSVFVLFSDRERTSISTSVFHFIIMDIRTKQRIIKKFTSLFFGFLFAKSKDISLLMVYTSQCYYYLDEIHQRQVFKNNRNEEEKLGKWCIEIAFWLAFLTSSDRFIDFNVFKALCLDSNDAFAVWSCTNTHIVILFYFNAFNRFTAIIAISVIISCSCLLHSQFSYLCSIIQ